MIPHGCELTGTEREYRGDVDEISPEGEDVVQHFGLSWGASTVKVTEAVIPQDYPVYVLGVATEAGLLPYGPSSDGAAGAGIGTTSPVVAAPAKGTAPFLICTQGPIVLERRLARTTLLQLAGGIVLVLLFAAFTMMEGMDYIQKTRSARFTHAVNAGNVTAVKAALTKVDLNKQDAHGDTALIRAARTGNVVRVRQLLAAGADPNSGDQDGRTALHAAVLARSSQTVKALLDGKAFVDIGDSAGNTPLHLAVKENDPALVRTLVAGGESPATYNNAHHTPLDIARTNHFRDVELALQATPGKP